MSTEINVKLTVNLKVYTLSISRRQMNLECIIGFALHSLLFYPLLFIENGNRNCL